MTTTLQGAGVSRVANGNSQLLGSSGEHASRVEALQGNLAEGPCFEAIIRRQPVHEPDLASDRAMERWPSFAPAAVAQGVVAVFAFPLLTGGGAVGALDLFAAEPGPLAADQVEDSALFAQLASLALDDNLGRPAIDGVSLATEAPESWAHSSVVHNASGMISEQLGIDVDEALLRIRALAFVTGRSAADLSRGVVDHRLRLDRWSSDG